MFAGCSPQHPPQKRLAEMWPAIRVSVSFNSSPRLAPSCFPTAVLPFSCVVVWGTNPHPMSGPGALMLRLHQAKVEAAREDDLHLQVQKAKVDLARCIRCSV